MNADLSTPAIQRITRDRLRKALADAGDDCAITIGTGHLRLVLDLLDAAPPAGAAGGGSGDLGAQNESVVIRDPLVEIEPDARKGKEPCGECHIRPGETCDICGASTLTPDLGAQGEPVDEEARELAASERISAAQAAYDYAMADYDPTAPDHEVYLFDAMKTAIAVADRYREAPTAPRSGPSKEEIAELTGLEAEAEGGDWTLRQQFANRWLLETQPNGPQFLPVTLGTVCTTVLEVGCTNEKTASNAKFIAAAVRYVRRHVLRAQAPAAPRSGSGVTVEGIANEAAFLLDRLREFENEHLTDETARDYYGHVIPSIERLTALLEALRPGETVNEWKPTGRGTGRLDGTGTDEWFRERDGVMQSFPLRFNPNRGRYEGIVIGAVPFQPHAAAQAGDGGADAP